MTCATAIRLRVPVETAGVGITHHVTVPFGHELWQAIRADARRHGIRPETAITEACRSYFLGDKE